MNCSRSGVAARIWASTRWTSPPSSAGGVCASPGRARSPRGGAAPGRVPPSACPVGTRGFSVGKKQAVISGGEGPCELVFDDCRVPDENVIGEVGMGFYAAMQFLTGGRANIGAMCVGIGDYLMRTSVEYAQNRVQFGKPIRKMQGGAFQIADMALEGGLARLATSHLALPSAHSAPLAHPP